MRIFDGILFEKTVYIRKKQWNNENAHGRAAEQNVFFLHPPTFRHNITILCKKAYNEILNWTFKSADNEYKNVYLAIVADIFIEKLIRINN